MNVFQNDHFLKLVVLLTIVNDDPQLLNFT